MICSSDPRIQAFCDADRTADGDGHAEFSVGGAWRDTDHRGNHICVDDVALGGTILFAVNGIIYSGGCAAVPVHPLGYEVRIISGAAGHIIS